MAARNTLTVAYRCRKVLQKFHPNRQFLNLDEDRHTDRCVQRVTFVGIEIGILQSLLDNRIDHATLE